MSADAEGNRFIIAIRLNDGSDIRRGCSNWTIKDGVLQLFKRVNLSINDVEKMVVGFPLHNIMRFEVSEL